MYERTRYQNLKYTLKTHGMRQLVNNPYMLDGKLLSTIKTNHTDQYWQQYNRYMKLGFTQVKTDYVFSVYGGDGKYIFEWPIIESNVTTGEPKIDFIVIE